MPEDHPPAADDELAGASAEPEGAELMKFFEDEEVAKTYLRED